MLTVLGKRQGLLTGAGMSQFVGIAQFNGTDDAGTLPVPFTRVFNASFTPLSNVDEVIALDEAANVVNGEIRRTGNGLTVVRPAGGASGLKFSFCIQGY